jgi:hypothetical protein
VTQCMGTDPKRTQTRASAFARLLQRGKFKGSGVGLVDLDDDSGSIGKGDWNDDPRASCSNLLSWDSGIGMRELPPSSTSKNPENNPGPPTEENNKGVDNSNRQPEIASPVDHGGSTVPLTEVLSESSEDVCSAVSTEDASESYSFIRAFPPRKPLLDSVTHWFEQWLNQQFRSRPCGCDSSQSGDNSRSDDPASAGTAGTTPSSSRSKKRPAGDLTPNDEDGSRGDQKRPRISATKEGEPRFACPFFKRDPSRYKDLRSCPGPGWTSIHRLKYVPGPHSTSDRIQKTELPNS